MPLSASVDGELMCGPLTDERTWSGLRGKDIVLQPCGHPGFPRVSRLGTKHFVHARDCGCVHAESAEHLRVKAVVAAAAAAAGWSAATEVSGEGYVADVMVERGRTRIAFEVQKSRQVLRDYERRQATYAAAGVRCLWLVADVPAGHRAGPQLPMFVVREWLTEPRCVVAGRSLPVADLVPALLSGACLWRETVSGRRTTFETLRQVCPMCGAGREVEVARWSTGGCDCGLPVVRPGQAIVWTGATKCCGYWGPVLTLGMRTRSRDSSDPVSAGHWCLSRAAPRRSPGGHG